MNQYLKQLREDLIKKEIHINDDVEFYKIGHIDNDYDFEEHEQEI